VDERTDIDGAWLGAVIADVSLTTYTLLESMYTHPLIDEHRQRLVLLPLEGGCRASSLLIGDDDGVVAPPRVMNASGG
jgi:hypothetical protein